MKCRLIVFPCSELIIRLFGFSEFTLIDGIYEYFIPNLEAEYNLRKTKNIGTSNNPVLTLKMM